MILDISILPQTRYDNNIQSTRSVLYGKSHGADAGKKPGPAIGSHCAIRGPGLCGDAGFANSIPYGRIPEPGRRRCDSGRLPAGSGIRSCCRGPWSGHGRPAVRLCGVCPRNPGHQSHYGPDGGGAVPDDEEKKLEPAFVRGGGRNPDDCRLLAV